MYTSKDELDRNLYELLTWELRTGGYDTTADPRPQVDEEFFVLIETIPATTPVSAENNFPSLGNLQRLAQTLQVDLSGVAVEIHAFYAMAEGGFSSVWDEASGKSFFEVASGGGFWEKSPFIMGKEVKVKKGRDSGLFFVVDSIAILCHNKGEVKQIWKGINTC